MARHLGTLTLGDLGLERGRNFEHLVEHLRCFQLVIGMNCQHLGRRKEPENNIKGIIIRKEVILRSKCHIANLLLRLSLRLMWGLV